MGIFEGFNLFKKRNLESEYMPDSKDIDFLNKVVKFNKKKDLSTENLDRLAEIEGNVNEILEYNSNIYDEFDCKDDDYRLIRLPDTITDLLKEAQDSVGVLIEGGVRNYRKKMIVEGMSRSPFHNFVNSQSELMLYFPEDYNRKLKPKGNWIMITEDIAVVSAPKKYDIHFATPVAKDCIAFGYKVKRWYASILVNNKEVLIEPREYTPIYDANALLQAVDKGITLVEGSSSARLDKNKVFYLKSRGFSQTEIYQILFKSITNKGFCHFRCDPEYANAFDRVKMGFKPELAFKIEEHLNNLPNFKFQKPC